MEEERGMDDEDESDSRKKLDEQKRKLQKELRDVEKVLACVSGGSGQPQEWPTVVIAGGGPKKA